MPPFTAGDGEFTVLSDTVPKMKHIKCEMACAFFLFTFLACQSYSMPFLHRLCLISHTLMVFVLVCLIDSFPIANGVKATAESLAIPH